MMPAVETPLRLMALPTCCCCTSLNPDVSPTSMPPPTNEPTHACDLVSVQVPPCTLPCRPVPEVAESSAGTVHPIALVDEELPWLMGCPEDDPEVTSVLATVAIDGSKDASGVQARFAPGNLNSLASGLSCKQGKSCCTDTCNFSLQAPRTTVVTCAGNAT